MSDAATRAEIHPPAQQAHSHRHTVIPRPAAASLASGLAAAVCHPVASETVHPRAPFRLGMSPGRPAVLVAVPVAVTKLGDSGRCRRRDPAEIRVSVYVYVHDVTARDFAIADPNR